MVTTDASAGEEGSDNNKGWLIDLEFYHKTTEGLSAFNLLPVENTELSTTISNGRAKAIGADLLVKKRWSRFRSWLIYSISKSQWQFAEVGRERFAATNDRRHQLKWVNTLELDRWLLSTAWHFHSGSPVTPADAFDNNFQSASFNGDRLENTHRLDLSVFYRWPEDRKSQGFNGKIGFSLINVYNRQNPLSQSFRSVQDFTGEEPRTFIEPVPRYGLGLTPNLSVSVGWK